MSHDDLGFHPAPPFEIIDLTSFKDKCLTITYMDERVIHVTAKGILFQGQLVEWMVRPWTSLFCWLLSWVSPSNRARLTESGKFITTYHRIKHWRWHNSLNSVARKHVSGFFSASKDITQFALSLFSLAGGINVSSLKV